MKKLIPERGRLLLEVDKVKEDIAAEGIANDGEKYKIVTPDVHHQRSRRATVLAVGDPSMPADVDRFKPGDRVLISWYTRVIVLDFELGWNDDTHRICRYDEVLGKFKE